MVAAGFHVAGSAVTGILLCVVMVAFVLAGAWHIERDSRNR